MAPASRAKRRRWDRGQSYRYLGRAAHRFATHQRLDIPVHLFGTEFWAASLNGRLRPGRQRGSGRAGSKRVKWRTNEYPCADTAASFRRRRASRRPRRCRRFAHFGRKSGTKLGRTLCYRSLPNSRFFALTFQKKCCHPSSWPRRTAALVTKTARRVADPLRELGSKHAEVRAPAQAKFL